MDRSGGKPPDVEHGQAPDEVPDIALLTLRRRYHDRPEASHDNGLDQDDSVGLGREQVQQELTHGIDCGRDSRGSARSPNPDRVDDIPSCAPTTKGSDPHPLGQ